MAFAGKEGAIYKAPNSHKTKIEKRYGIFEQHLRSRQLRVAMAYFYRKSFLLMFIVIYHLNYVRVILDKMEAKRKGWYYRPAQQLVSELANRTLLIRAIAMRGLTKNAASTPWAMGLGTARVMILELLARRKSGGNSEESDRCGTLSKPHSRCGVERWAAAGAFSRAMVIYKYKYLYITIRE